jgi:hypothetical protein
MTCTRVEQDTCDQAPATLIINIVRLLCLLVSLLRVRRLAGKACYGTVGDIHSTGCLHADRVAIGMRLPAVYTRACSRVLCSVADWNALEADDNYGGRFGKHSAGRLVCAHESL